MSVELTGMTRDFDGTVSGPAWFSSTVRPAGPGQLRRRSRALLLVGVLLALTVPAGAARAMQGPPDWVEELSLADKVPAGSVTMISEFYRASHVSQAETYEYLERFGLEHLALDAGVLLDPEVTIRGSDAFHGVLEARADWAAYRLELNGKFASRETTEILGQAMTVTAVISSEGLRFSDDRGGSRTEAYRVFPLDACDRVGEFTPPLSAPAGNVRAGGGWREPSSWDLIDLRASEIVIDSVDAARVASGRPILSVYLPGFSEVLRFEGGEAFAVAMGRDRPFALLPLETPLDIWRIVYASGGPSRKYKFRVDYTDELVRARIRTGDDNPSIVVEAPRSRESLAPVSFVHPGAEMLTDAMRSRVRLRTAEPLDEWLDGAFEKERLPIVLRPFHPEGLVPREVRYGLIEVETGAEPGVVRAAASVEPHLQFGPAEGCEVEADRVLCAGGASDVIGEESPRSPW